MTEPFTGGCACGAVRFEVAGEPADMNHCQCRQCQHASGTGHGSHLTFVGAEITLSGPANHWTVTGEMGTRKSRAFCPTCGHPAYITFPDMPGVFVVFAGSLDDPGRFAPQVTMWAAAAKAWDAVDPALPSFARMPPR